MHTLPGQSRIVLTVLVAIVLSMVTTVAVWTSLQQQTILQQAAASCTVTVAGSVDTIDGSGNYSQIRPGDTICLAAGNRGSLVIKNLRGQAGSPITIVNSGGVVRIAGSRIGVEIQTSSYIRLTGSGVSTNCGSQFAASAQQCGIDISDTTKALTAESPAGDVNNLEIDHITVHTSNPDGAFPTGISMKPQNLKHMTGIYIHHNYVHDTAFEGMYIGDDPNKPAADNGTMSNVEISHNLIEKTGFDGINLKQATGAKVHHNIIRISGLMNGQVAHVPEGGIQMAASTGEVYNNLIIDSDDTGINIGRELNNSNSKFYNNVVVSSTNEGIKTSESNASIYNNTVINSGAAGIAATGANASVSDNIVVGTITGKNNGNNLIGNVTSMGFVNPSANDFHLTASSPAVNTGGNGTFPAFDFDNTSRPQGSKADKGAYEFGGSPSPTSISGGTKLGLTLLLHGIGKGGDNVAPGGAGNMNPQRQSRQATVEVFDSNNQLAMTKQGVVTFNAVAGNFQGTIDVVGLPTGIYQVRLRVPQYLGKIIPGIVSITVGQTIQLPSSSLVTGDIDSNNQVNILDYNLLLDCFSELSAARNCANQDKKLMADLTDDGNVNQFDYNLLLREFSVQGGT